MLCPSGVPKILLPSLLPCLGHNSQYVVSGMRNDYIGWLLECIIGKSAISCFWPIMHHSTSSKISRLFVLLIVCNAMQTETLLMSPGLDSSVRFKSTEGCKMKTRIILTLFSKLGFISAIVLILRISRKTFGYQTCSIKKPFDSDCVTIRCFGHINAKGLSGHRAAQTQSNRYRGIQQQPGRHWEKRTFISFPQVSMEIHQWVSPSHLCRLFSQHNDKGLHVRPHSPIRRIGSGGFHPCSAPSLPCNILARGKGTNFLFLRGASGGCLPAARCSGSF